MGEEKGRSKKANKLMGESNLSSQVSHTHSSISTHDRALSEKAFEDEWTIPFDKKYGPLAQFAATQLLSDRRKVPETDYGISLSGMDLFKMSYQPLSIKTKDGASISALEIGDPQAEHCLIVFQPKDGNFKDSTQLHYLFQMAEKTGARVIAFNYRDKPSSLDSFDYDGCAVTQYAMRTTSAEKITFYGESLGGAIAAETAAKIEHDENKQVKILCARAPNSLAEAGKHMNLSELMKENADPEIEKKLSQLKKVQKLPLAGMQVGTKLLYGRDFNTEESLNKLDAGNVVRLRVQGDAIVTEKATSSRTVLGFTEQKNKHNAPLTKITVFPDNPQSKDPQKPSKQGMTGEDLLVELVNRDNALQKTTTVKE